MVASRRAAMRGASPSLVAGVRAALTLISLALAAVLAALGVASVHMARRVVTPARRVPDTRILSLDTAAQTITLSRTPDTELPGRYGLFTTGTASYVKLGSVLSEDDASVKRKLLTHIPADAQLSPDAAFSGWYYDSADELHLPYTPELIGSAVGPCPAWLFPAGVGRRVGHPGAWARHHPRRVPARGAGVPLPSGSRRSSCRTATTARRRAVARAPTHSGRRSGATSTPQSASRGAAARSASS